jgi:1-acyl-sn-glycerol-3-phosphate acyltransferase
MFKRFSTYWFKKNGWSFEGEFEPLPKKFIIIVGPHTANIDFLIGIMARSVLGIQSTKFLGKSQLFKFPHGFIFRALGGYPVVRTKDNNLVDAVTEIFNRHERFSIAIAPEGTRSKVQRLKTGFYHIAKSGNIPIYAVGFDFGTKTIRIKEPFIPSDNIEKDFQELLGYYSGMKGKYPELGITMSILKKTISDHK